VSSECLYSECLLSVFILSAFILCAVYVQCHILTNMLRVVVLVGYTLSINILSVIHVAIAILLSVVMLGTIAVSSCWLTSF
jgi:hypothetical protein